MYILNLLNKIKWGQNLNPEEHSIIYLDKNFKKEIKFNKILNFNNLTLELNNNIEIPLHRIREVKKGDEIIWKR